MSTAAAVRSFETAVVVLVALNLSFLPWAFGGVDAWSQFASLALAAAAFALALPAGGWPRLRAFPIFWAGAALLGYVAVQSLNPAFRYVRDDTSWWLVRVAHVGWLPAGMDAPFAGNGWRTMVVWSSCWLTACAIWIGPARESSLRLLLNAICANALLLAAFGLAQRVGGAEAIYGSRAVRVPYFFAAFIYKHHAAAYFSLLACTAIGLALHSRHSDRSQSARPGPVIAQAGCALACILSVGLTFSFSGLVLLGLALLGLAPAMLREILPAPRAARGRGRGPMLAAAALILGTAVMSAGGSAEVRESVRLRALAARSGVAMLQDRWADGWGAGCFSYGFTKYQKAEPELARWQHLKLRWEHLHNDWLELLIELGVVGALPVAFMAWFWIGRIFRLGLWRAPLPSSVLAGVALVGAHGLIDFPLQNPAVLITAGTLLTVTVRMGAWERNSAATA
jgi:O-antigen ligase